MRSRAVSRRSGRGHRHTAKATLRTRRPDPPFRAGATPSLLGDQHYSHLGIVAPKQASSGREQRLIHCRAQTYYCGHVSTCGTSLASRCQRLFLKEKYSSILTGLSNYATSEGWVQGFTRPAK